MNYFRNVLIFLALIASCKLHSDSVLNNLASNLTSLANYSEIIRKFEEKKQVNEMTFDEWYKKCNALPFYRTIDTNYTNKAIEWQELQNTINKFIEINTEILSKKEIWLEDAPNPTDSFFTTKNGPLDPIQPFIQKLLIKPGIKIGFHGDFHGDVHSMVEYIQRLNTDKYMHGFKIIDPNFYLIFLGDYEDRGIYGAEVWYSLMRLKIANPEKVIIIRGNHEDPLVAMMYGFRTECGKFKNDDPHAFDKITRIFDLLPVALYLGIETDKLINFLLCVHGGFYVILDESAEEFKLKPALDLQDLLSTKSPLAYKWLKLGNTAPNNLTNIGFLWNDFNINPKAKTNYKPGRGFEFSKKDTEDYLKQQSNINSGYELKGIFRAHQHASAAGNAMMNDMIAGDGVSKFWANETNANKSLWDNIVCTFLVGPDTIYGKVHNYNWDGFGILNTAEKYEDWNLNMYKNEVVK